MVERWISKLKVFSSFRFGTIALYDFLTSDLPIKW